MSVLVTGGAGFIGSYLVDRLMTEGHRARVLDNLASGSLDNLKQWDHHPRFEFLRGDLLDRETVKSALNGCAQVLDRIHTHSIQTP